MADVFVSYSRRDKARVGPIVSALESRGWSVWWDPAISAGQEFDLQIADELAQAAAVLVVWTTDSVQSRWVRGEARDAADRGILVPVRCGDTSLPIDFRSFHTVDLGQDPRMAGSVAFEEVIRAVGALVGKSKPDAIPELTTRPVPSAAHPDSARAAICVLPFKSFGGDPEEERLSAAIAADIIRELSRWRALAVRPRSASFRYRGDAADPTRIARELNIRYIVEGEVRRIGDHIRIGVELTDAQAGCQVWGERFDQSWSDVLAAQDDLVRRVAATLVSRVQKSDTDIARRKQSSNLDAYECVQRGNALPWDDPEAASEAIRLFHQAITLDPDYAIAHALLGTMRVGQWRNDPGTPDSLLDEAFRLNRRAVELDDDDSTCHSLLAHVCMYRRSYELALDHMRRSVELNPNNAWNRADMGLVLTYAGTADEALAFLKQAREIDPHFDPPWYWRTTGQVYMTMKRFADALEALAHVPLRTGRVCAYLAACHARLGDTARARAFAQECLAHNPDFSVGHFISREPYRDHADSDYLAESLRLAGLPD
jgi:TolB-like protein/Flp pilus assembly protein TadD